MKYKTEYLYKKLMYSKWQFFVSAPYGWVPRIDNGKKHGIVMEWICHI